MRRSENYVPFHNESAPLNLAISGLDAAIVVVYIVMAVMFGLWIGRGQHDASGYLLGGRDLPWWAVLLSIVATETSTVTFLSVPGLAFASDGDFRFLQLSFGYILGRILVVFLFLPHYFRGTMFTAYEVLHHRFGGGVKQTASLMFIVMRNLADGLRLFLTALVLKHVVGFDLATCVVLMGVCTIIYTFFGGMRAVVWNDCIQFVVYMAGALLAGYVIVAQLPGGWPQLASFAVEHDKLRLFDFSFDLSANYTVWAGLIGGLFLTLGTHGTDQLMVQRYLGARSQRDAARALVASGFIVFAQFAVFLGVGVGLACFYQEFSPETPFKKHDEVFASFIVTHMPVGAVGVTLAAVFSAAMSTLSSSLNSSATAAVIDLYVPWFKADLNSPRTVRVSRLLTVVFGLIQIAVGIAGQKMADNVVESVLAIAGFTSGVILGVFFLGVLTRHVGESAALIGLVTGLVVMAVIHFVVPEHRPEWTLGWPWYTVVGSSVTFFVGLGVAILFPSEWSAASKFESPDSLE